MNDPWLMSCGLLCVWPFAMLMVGIWIGRHRVRLRSPLAIDKGREEYAPSPNERARAYVRTQIAPEVKAPQKPVRPIDS